MMGAFGRMGSLESMVMVFWIHVVMDASAFWASDTSTTSSRHVLSRDFPAVVNNNDFRHARMNGARRRTVLRMTTTATEHSQTPRDDTAIPHHTTRQFAFELSTKLPPLPRRRRLFRRKKPEPQLQRLSFRYDSNILELKSKANTSNNNDAEPTTTDPPRPPARKTTGVILIHPIGVGIGKWFYNRLLESLYDVYQSQAVEGQPNLVVVVPDLLGSGTAANPILSSEGTPLTHRVPLLQVKDWSSQIGRLLANVEKEYPMIDEWCLVANGGCSPIALQVASQAVKYQQSQQQLPQQQQQAKRQTIFASHYFQNPVTHVVLSSVPRLPFFLPEDDTSRQTKLDKVHKSYHTLCGTVGRIFWWYALRNNGAFIQTFSERNLVADPANLGNDWTPHCVATARMYQGNSRYSTFSFLAGSLQAEGCRNSLATLRDSGVVVDIIQGRDRRRNRAKSWFWQRKKRATSSARQKTTNNLDERSQRESLQQVLQRNGNRGDVIQVGGRISLAHEDAPGYARALVDFLARPGK